MSTYPFLVHPWLIEAQVHIFPQMAITRITLQSLIGRYTSAKTAAFTVTDATAFGRQLSMLPVLRLRAGVMTTMAGHRGICLLTGPGTPQKWFVLPITSVKPKHVSGSLVRLILMQEGTECAAVVPPNL
jgi:hypothetical protein